MPGQLSTGDFVFRTRIYDHFAGFGRAPIAPQLVSMAPDQGDVDAALRRLHDAHLIVLDGRRSVRMALPFSSVDTGHTVRSADRTWMANCAWDALAVPIALAVDAAIEATWLDDGTPVEIDVVGDDLSHYDGFIHFQIPARQWWDDIVET